MHLLKPNTSGYLFFCTLVHWIYTSLPNKETSSLKQTNKQISRPVVNCCSGFDNLRHFGGAQMVAGRFQKTVLDLSALPLFLQSRLLSGAKGKVEAEPSFSPSSRRTRFFSPPNCSDWFQAQPQSLDFYHFTSDSSDPLEKTNIGVQYFGACLSHCTSRLSQIPANTSFFCVNLWLNWSVQLL